MATIKLVNRKKLVEHTHDEENTARPRLDLMKTEKKYSPGNVVILGFQEMKSPLQKL